MADLVEAMRMHQEHAGLQREASGTLGSLARLSEKNKKSIAQSGGIQEVVTAMRAHPAALEQVSLFPLPLSFVSIPPVPLSPSPSPSPPPLSVLLLFSPHRP